MENRIKKLSKEEERLKKQIAIAQKHTIYAGEVGRRRYEDYVVQVQHKSALMNDVVRQAHINNDRREKNIQSVIAHAQVVRKINSQICGEIKVTSKLHDQNIVACKVIEKQKKQINAAQKYQVRKEVEKKSRYDKELYLDEIAKIHQEDALKVTEVKERHEDKLRVLEQVESRKIADLTRTIAAQKMAMHSL